MAIYVYISLKIPVIWNKPGRFSKTENPGKVKGGTISSVWCNKWMIYAISLKLRLTIPLHFTWHSIYISSRFSAHTVII